MCDSGFSAAISRLRPGAREGASGPTERFHENDFGADGRAVAGG